MAKKPRSATVDYLVYFAIRCAVCLIQGLPEHWARGFANLLAWIAYQVDRRHREVARENLQHAFPERCADPVECDRMVRAIYRHFLQVVVEIVILPRKFHLTNWMRLLEFPDAPRVVEAITSGRAVILATGHFGNWEIGGYSLGTFGFQSYAIARTLDNPYLDRFLKKFRQRTGQTILCKNGDFDRIVNVLAERGVLSTLADQDAGQRGLFVPFFNRPASTHKAVALMAIEYDALMCVMSTVRVGQAWPHRVLVADIIDAREYAERSDAVEAITLRMTQGLEAMIRQFPEQYFWLHRRWKHLPPVRKAKKAA